MCSSNFSAEPFFDVQLKISLLVPFLTNVINLLSSYSQLTTSQVCQTIFRDKHQNNCTAMTETMEQLPRLTNIFSNPNFPPTNNPLPPPKKKYTYLRLMFENPLKIKIFLLLEFKLTCL